MIFSLQKSIIQALWSQYSDGFRELNTIIKSSNIRLQTSLNSSKPNVTLDHVAIIDLKSANSGIDYMKKILNILHMDEYGSGYIEERQNHFTWLTNEQNFALAPEKSLPQVIIADFEYDAMSKKNRDILYKYAKQSKPIDMQWLQSAVHNIKNGDLSHKNHLICEIVKHFSNIAWDLPYKHEYLSVLEENELAAWVLLFGRKVNHFGIGMYMHPNFHNLNSFNQHLIDELNIKMNEAGGLIKGSQDLGIEQSSTLGVEEIGKCHDNQKCQSKSKFIEFVWRHSQDTAPSTLSQYFTGFLAGNATYVIESIL